MQVSEYPALHFTSNRIPIKIRLLVTTHYDPLLKTVGDELIRRDSVWFPEKDMTGYSELYSLVEYKGLNRIPSLQKAYRNGVFGALPNIK